MIAAALRHVSMEVMRFTVLALLLLATACTRFNPVEMFRRGDPASLPPPEVVEVVVAPPPPSGARTVEQFDTTTETQRAAATDISPAAEEALGSIVVSLGPPGEVGLWLQTPQVDAPRAGRIVAPNGKEALVELRPGEGGARLSLAAMRLLDLPLTDLPMIRVYAR